MKLGYTCVQCAGDECVFTIKRKTGEHFIMIIHTDDVDGYTTSNLDLTLQTCSIKNGRFVSATQVKCLVLDETDGRTTTVWST
jgi:hypothetical protein